MPSYRLSGTVDRHEWMNRYPRLTPRQVQTVSASLMALLGPDVVVTDRDALLAYSYDATGERHWPDVVVIPRNAGEVSQALDVAHRFRVPVIGRGASTNLSGGTTPLVGGMVVSFARMNRILAIDPANRWCRVEPGVVNADLADALNAIGYFYPPDPASHRISTIGGNLAENSGGPHCVKYGVTTHHVRGLKLALSDGRILELPPVGFTADGVDLASVVVGGEGTLGLVTEAVLAIQPRPQGASTALAVFPSLDAAVQSVSAIVAAGIQPSALEVMDQISVRVVESFVHAGYPPDAGAVLLVEIDGDAAVIGRKMGTVRGLCAARGAGEFRVAASPAEAEMLWRGRRAHYGATARMAPHLWVQDVTVPRPKLAAMMNQVGVIAREQGLSILTAAHAGDGNLHPNIPYDPDDPEQVARLKAADRAILEACVAMGGSITGEHGIGIDKAEHLPLMYSPWELAVLMEIKAAFDPEGIFNPLKALWPPGSLPSAPPVPERRPLNAETVAHVQDAMRWSQAKSETLAIRGQGRRSHEPSPSWLLSMTGFTQIHDLDTDNFSVEVGAGMPAGALARVLAGEGLDIPGLEPFMDDTIGGLVASNAPFWRHGAGNGWRDWLLAAEWVDARGRILRFGRKTMKNVAGYDVVKLMVGSQGRLGALTRLTLRAQPRSEGRVVAQSAEVSPETADDLVARLLSRPDGPEGLLLVKRPSASTVSLWCVGSDGPSGLRAQLGPAAAAQWRLLEGEDAWLEIERQRMHEVYQAHSVGRYHSGRIPIGETAASLRENRGWVFVSPQNRFYELLDASTDPWTWSGDAQVARLRERIGRIFDPEQLLR